MFQLTQLQVSKDPTGYWLNMQYSYSATQNNGKITSESDNLSGEQVAYTYDALNRLASAQTTQIGGTQWGQSYTYDGFGNLTDQTVIKGSAPDVHVAYNASNNRQTSDTADANGNIGSGSVYDMDNRLVQPVASGSVAYGYDVANKRVWRGDTSLGPGRDCFLGRTEVGDISGFDWRFKHLLHAHIDQRIFRWQAGLQRELRHRLE